ncbi:ABC transporter ATP-binding protein [Micromonospora yangpuensis]|uniref:Iron complex transport system ATP-binding protein n=1 Tax=Micromonospora yangpuensis TaxID=683228 RepID=A0A1C6UL57_9ACTN|nr:ABC transporter ATP-binding protein [Micromonospora yangpuensis]GGM17214.1 ABC transporter ATP-binding protein [Micromonospora yangpuensis]SCL54593.1 iron complex transport system ATP-binding protein [Micromonospora yangpuensis]
MDLLLDSLTVAVDGQRLVDALELKVGHEEVVGLLGPNGSGKSTTLRCVYRALAPTAGRILLDGEDITIMDRRACARRLAAMTQEQQVALDFSVAEVVAMGRAPHRRDHERLTGADQELCHQALAMLDVAHLAHRSVLTLSGGERQRVLIARALVQQPQVLVLDEPTNHLDIHHQLALLGLLRRAGLTTLVALHDLNLAAAACDRIALLREGRLVTVGPPAEVLTPELVRAVFDVDAVVVTHPRTGTPQLLFDAPAGPLG